MALFNDRELITTIPFISYLLDNSFHKYQIEWVGHEGYIAEFLTAFEDDNEDVVGEEYMEFNSIAFTITEVIHNGPRRYEGTITFDYRDFPDLVKDLTADKVLFDSVAGISLP